MKKNINDAVIHINCFSKLFVDAGLCNVELYIAAKPSNISTKRGKKIKKSNLSCNLYLIFNGLLP